MDEVFDAGQAVPQFVLDAALTLHPQKNTDLVCSPLTNADESLPESNPL